MLFHRFPKFRFVPRDEPSKICWYCLPPYSY
uniref:Uncharacterized protein n=1 Tax=Arundo donax TaxID=35708 RepID=A0A0A8Y6N0_ARUDO